MYRILTSIFVATALVVLSGCGSYMLKGRVVRGDFSSVELVYADDARLQQPGVNGVEVRITRDPTTLNRYLAGQARSNPAGDFTLVMNEFGTGWMKEHWLVQGVVGGYQNAEMLMNLPGKGSKWRLLITMTPGSSEPFRDDDLMQELERFR